MKGQFDFTLNDHNFNQTSYVSQWFDISGFIDFSFIVFCSSNCDQVVEYSFDKNYEIVRTDLYNLIANTTNEIKGLVRTRYIRFSIKNINVNPCILSTQSFYSE
jgi:hypothetical protein